MIAQLRLGRGSASNTGARSGCGLFGTIHTLFLGSDRSSFFLAISRALSTFLSRDLARSIGVLVLRSLTSPSSASLSEGETHTARRFRGPALLPLVAFLFGAGAGAAAGRRRCRRARASAAARAAHRASRPRRRAAPHRRLRLPGPRRWRLRGGRRRWRPRSRARSPQGGIRRRHRRSPRRHEAVAATRTWPLGVEAVAAVARLRRRWRPAGRPRAGSR